MLAIGKLVHNLNIGIGTIIINCLHYKKNVHYWWIICGRHDPSLISYKFVMENGHNAGEKGTKKYIYFVAAKSIYFLFFLATLICSGNCRR